MTALAEIMRVVCELAPVRQREVLELAERLLRQQERNDALSLRRRLRAVEQGGGSDGQAK